MFPHTLGDAQSRSATHAVRQADAVAQVYPPHVTAAGTWQCPFPSQVEAACSVAVEQVAAPQTLPAGWRRQAPAPSQVPSVWHVEASSARQGAAGSGSCPAGTKVHVPALPMSAHE